MSPVMTKVDSRLDWKKGSEFSEYDVKAVEARRKEIERKLGHRPGPDDVLNDAKNKSSIFHAMFYGKRRKEIYLSAMRNLVRLMFDDMVMIPITYVGGKELMGKPVRFLISAVGAESGREYVPLQESTKEQRLDDLVQRLAHARGTLDPVKDHDAGMTKLFNLIVEELEEKRAEQLENQEANQE